MAFVVGDSFLIGSDANSLHLHVVICGPTAETVSVVIVSFNTAQDWTDKTVVLQVGEHPFIERETSVNFQLAQVVPIVHLERMEQRNAPLAPNFSTFRRHAPASAQLIEKLIQGCLASPLTPKFVKKAVRERTVANEENITKF